MIVGFNIEVCLALLLPSSVSYKKKGYKVGALTHSLDLHNTLNADTRHFVLGTASIQPRL